MDTCQRFKDVVAMENLQGTKGVILCIMKDLFWTEEKRAQDGFNLLFYLFQCAGYDFVKEVLCSLFNVDNYVFPTLCIANTLNNVYDFPDPLEAVKILLRYSKNLKLRFKKGLFNILFFNAMKRQDYDILRVLEASRLRPHLSLSDFYWGRDLKMLHYFANLPGFDMFSDPDDVKRTIQNAMVMIGVMEGEAMLEYLRIAKFIFDKAGKEEYLQDVSHDVLQLFRSFMRLQEAIEKRAANRIYFWVYPKLYRNQEFVSRQAERSWDNLQRGLL